MYQVAGAGASYDSYRDELVHADAWGQSDQLAHKFMAGSDYMGQTGYAQASDDTCAYDNYAWGYYPPSNVLAAKSQGMSSCWNPACDRVHTGIYLQAPCGNCQTFEPGSSE